MKIGILFPGYGSQFVGMGKDLYDQSRLMQEYFEQASNCLDINFIKLCFASSDAELAHISNAYVALFLVNASLYSLLRQEGITADRVAGHGVGEYAALYAAGSISLPDALYMLQKFAAFYGESLEQGKFSVAHVLGADDEQLEAWCAEHSTGKDTVTITAHNTPDDHYVSGPRKAVQKFTAFCNLQEGVTCTELDEGYGLHSAHVDEVVEKLTSYLPKVDFKDLAIPMINCVDGVQVVSCEPAKYSVIRQINNPILWNQVLSNFTDCDTIITVGPGSALGEMARKRFPEKSILSFSTPG